MRHVLSNHLPSVVLRPTFSKNCYSQPLTPPYWCIRAPPLHMSEPYLSRFPHFVRHRGHSHLILYNFVPNFLSPTMRTHPSEHPRLRYLHLLNVCVLDKPTLCPIQVTTISFSMKAANRNDEDLENGMSEKDTEKSVRSNKAVTVHNKALLSGVAYCISSCSMILVNKYVLSSYDFNGGISLMLYQNFVSVVVVSSLRLFGIISTEPLTWRLVRVWLPINVIFVGMLITSMFSLKYINVAMVTVLKNVTNVITAAGEMYLFNTTHDSRVWTALFLMIISAITGGITDLSFHAIGYTWQIINCFLTASYSGLLEHKMRDFTHVNSLKEFSPQMRRHVEDVINLMGRYYEYRFVANSASNEVELQSLDYADIFQIYMRDPIHQCGVEEI
ncbi:GDP-mannose transporter GONST2 [Capsicum baccatum]|uniref:GDP-mannose transporter GONST2 n=1 Tax=Capsicum baccatum TaxID=33114 RepID=A0A2G2VNN5_CAPBA|nr:GDP-mannose transporter GONST2 [Capsicum baccatum]